MSWDMMYIVAVAISSGHMIGQMSAITEHANVSFIIIK